MGILSLNTSLQSPQVMQTNIEVSTKVMKKTLDIKEQQGQAVIQLIESSNLGKNIDIKV